ncbi:uncharacterized protein LY79DRAFT_572377 [Colletotrichum navitas]|uniref:Uncharacterized protein n=1 Tax=Colletotrichum navitas TaxID=681940 RepID=A0AAD8PL95_9PEZI|nr:uncharacterized protein LY79DRAFT_572377 [Colletotrichum navitas]KAK1566260.1 hypothetical protein LY79DRAFT_572377 [Colletotrichum navitas]
MSTTDRDDFAGQSPAPRPSTPSSQDRQGVLANSSPLSSARSDVSTPSGWSPSSIMSAEPPRPSQPPETWTTHHIVQLCRILDTHYAPFALGALVRLMGSRDFALVGIMLVRIRQSARAESDRRHSGIAYAFNVPIAHQTGGGCTTVISGADTMVHRTFDSGGNLISSHAVDPDDLYLY